MQPFFKNRDILELFSCKILKIEKKLSRGIEGNRPTDKAWYYEVEFTKSDGRERKLCLGG